MTTSTTTAGTTMRAIIQENYGEAENVLRLGQTGRPAIGDREVLLRVHAAGVDRGVVSLKPGPDGQRRRKKVSGENKLRCGPGSRSCTMS